MATDFGVDVLLHFVEGGAGADIDPNFTLVTGPRLVGQASACRLLTPRSGLLGSPDYGRDVRLELNEAMTPLKAFAAQQAYVAEVTKDERVLAARAAVRAPTGDGPLRVSVDLETDRGPFGLTLDVGATTSVRLREGG